MKLNDFITGKKGSLFRRYFAICFFTLLFCTLMLGLVMLSFSSQLFRQEKTDTLTASVAKASEILEANLASHAYIYVTADEVEDQMDLIQKTAGATVLFCDLSGNVRLCSEGGNCTHKSSVVPGEILEQAATGAYSGISSMSGFLSTGSYVYGTVFAANDMVYGYMFAFAPVTDLFNYMGQIGIVFLASTALMLLAAFFLVNYIVSVSLEPLKSISEAASRFGSGDMSARAIVRGDDEIGQLAQVFNAMADSVEELEKTRQSFVANLSHELRTPMTSISGYIDGILDGTIPREDESKYLQITSSEIKRLARLSQSLLDLARMEASSETNLSDVRVWDVIINVMLGSEKKISDKKIEVNDLEPTDLSAVVNPDMLHQVVYNLIDNAVKFTPDGGSLKIGAEKRDDTVVMTVQNSGPGISAEDLPHIFERFYKSDKSRAMDKTGTGLGLYIVRTLVERMNGTITAESAEGEYARFTVILPAAVPTVEGELVPETPPKRIRGRRKAGKEENGNG